MLLGAYYYLWYGSPVVPIVGGGDWERAGSKSTPVLGEYNSRDPGVISRHIDWAKEASLDFLAVSWNNISSWDNETLKDYYLKHPKSSELKFCIFYDSIPALNRHRFGQYVSYDLAEPFSPQMTKGEKFQKDFEYLSANYFKLPNYLKIQEKPVVVIYNASAFRNVKKYFEALPELFLVADAVCWSGASLSRSNLSFLWTTSPQESVKTIFRAFRRLSLNSYEEDFSLSKYFKAITGYNLVSHNRVKNFLKDIDKLYEKFSAYAQSKNLCFFPNIMPGYNDKSLMPQNQVAHERRDGEFYKEFWGVAKKYFNPGLPLALITSFNEWHEDTQIEPAKEYGEQYLELTKQYKNLCQT